MIRRAFLILLTSVSVVVYGHTQNWLQGSIKGEGPTVTETWDLDPLHGIGLSFSGDVILTQGSTQSVQVEGQKNVLDNIQRQVKSGYWNIKFDKNVRNHEKVIVRVTMSSLDKVSLSGSGNITTTNRFTGLQDVSVSVSGSGDISLNLSGEDINCRISGSGKIDLAGQASSTEVAISGSGDLHAFDLQSESSKIRISGSGDVEISASSSVAASISGSGGVRYKGGATNINSKVSGSGKVRSM